MNAGVFLMIRLIARLFMFLLWYSINVYFFHLILSFYTKTSKDFGDGHDVEANIPGLGTFLLKSQFLKKSSK